jgi:formylglycine-generating enzyme required for sulfatase activity
MSGSAVADIRLRGARRYGAAPLRVWPAFVCLALVCVVVACRPGAESGQGEANGDEASARQGSVTISGDDQIAESLTWRIPPVEVAEDQVDDVRRRADEALREGDLYQDAEAAIPLYLGVLRTAPDDARAKTGLRRSAKALLERGDERLAEAGDDIDALREAHRIAAVARTVWPGDETTLAYLGRVDLADRLWTLNSEGEAELAAGRFGAQGGGALARFHEVLRLAPGQPRALQGVAAVESGLIAVAEGAAASGDFDAATRWLELAARVRPGNDTIDDARARIERIRSLRVARLRDDGLRALPEYNGVRKARDILAEMLRIARPGDAAAAELRTRIDLATHYGLFRPGQRFTDALENGGRGPRMIVVPHGAFRMGARADERDARPYEQPARYLRFDRGFAMSVHEVTVGEFKRYLAATGARTRAARRGFSMPYDERSNNFARRSLVGPGSDYLGNPAADDMPVLHVSATDADEYAQWLSEQTGRNYRLPSEAEFEYALRAGGATRYPWGDRTAPPDGAGNFTGARDRSPGGRSWSNAFAGYGDGYWGPAPVGSFDPNAFGLHDLSGNVSEWVADCWHASYRRAPKDPKAWYNPGCRTRVIRGGSWASSPVQLRSAWRAPLERDTTNAQIGFRLVRDL